MDQFYNQILNVIIAMKKIKYGNKKIEPQNRQIENLKEGDEICEAVLDTFSDDYLSYITHLVKNTKTPNKAPPQKPTPHISSDQQPQQKWKKVSPIQLQKTQNVLHESKPRRHSQASAKVCSSQGEQYKKNSKHKNESTKVSPRTKINEIAEKEHLLPKSKKRKIEYIHNEAILKNQQKTMQFSRNTVQNYKFKDQRDYDFEKDLNKKSRITHKSKDKYYITSQNYQDTDHEPSIELPLKKQQNRERKGSHQNFIDNINQYITTLQENQSMNQYYMKRQSMEERDKQVRRMHRSKRMRVQEQEQYDIQQILKQNLKLSKKVKNYEQKISQLDEEISNHLMQCSNKEKTYKNKINYLLRGLIQAFMKIDAQHTEIAALKDLHRTYGQKVKQIDNKFDDDDILQDIREELFKNLAPKRHSSQIRTKHKKVLESTLPKYDEDRRFW